MNERRNYSKAFKLEAVRLLALGEIPAARLARGLDIRPYCWSIPSLCI